MEAIFLILFKNTDVIGTYRYDRLLTSAAILRGAITAGTVSISL